MSKGHITYTPEVLETIRIRLIRLEGGHGSPTRLEIAERLHREVSTIHKFIQGVDPSSSLAADLIAEFPELGQDIRCPFCHRFMPGVISA